MTALLLAILASTIIGVIFKCFSIFKIDNFQAIIVNYFTCLILGSILNQSIPFSHEVISSAWFKYDIGLGFLFIFGFNIAAISYQKFGIALTSVMQRMSLIITVAVTILYFGESAHWLKITGILIAISAIYLVNKKSADIIPDGKMKKVFFLFPTLVLLLSAVIEVILFYVEHTQIVQGQYMAFTTHSFGMAAIFGSLVFVPGIISGKFIFQWKNVLAGIILGIPNYFSIYLITIMLSDGFEASVGFPILNVSVLLLSALLAWKIFNEHLSKFNWAGIIFSIIAIVLITLSSL
jgi:drug/metabolite transporter (DMT)-like permease